MSDRLMMEPEFQRFYDAIRRFLRATQARSRHLQAGGPCSSRKACSDCARLHNSWNGAIGEVSRAAGALNASIKEDCLLKEWSELEVRRWAATTGVCLGCCHVIMQGGGTCADCGSVHGGATQMPGINAGHSRKRLRGLRHRKANIGGSPVAQLRQHASPRPN